MCGACLGACFCEKITVFHSPSIWLVCIVLDMVFDGSGVELEVRGFTMDVEGKEAGSCGVTSCVVGAVKKEQLEATWPS